MADNVAIQEWTPPKRKSLDVHRSIESQTWSPPHKQRRTRRTRKAVVPCQRVTPLKGKTRRPSLATIAVSGALDIALAFLSIPDLLSLACSSQLLNKHVKRHSFWSYLIERDFGLVFRQDAEQKLASSSPCLQVEPLTSRQWQDLLSEKQALDLVRSAHSKRLVQKLLCREIHRYPRVYLSSHNLLVAYCIGPDSFRRYRWCHACRFLDAPLPCATSDDVVCHECRQRFCSCTLVDELCNSTELPMFESNKLAGEFYGRTQLSESPENDGTPDGDCDTTPFHDRFNYIRGGVHLFGLPVEATVPQKLTCRCAKCSKVTCQACFAKAQWTKTCCDSTQ